MNYAGARLTARRRSTRLSQASQPNLRRHKPDYILVVLMSMLLMVGAVVVYAIGPGLTGSQSLPENYYSSKQITAIVLGIIGFIIAAAIPIESWKKIQAPLVITAFVFALLVRVVGEEINGAHRWIQVGGFSFQAAELIKLALVLWLAYFLSNRRLEGRMAEKSTLRVLGAVIIIVSVIVAGLQSDLGSSAVMLAIIGVTSFIAGLPLRFVGLALAGILILGMLFIGSSQYRRDRVTTFFNPTADCRAEGYQACQALITIGSGGMFGKGLGKSVQAYGYLPEPANDSIFAIVAEKFGFVGTLAVISIFTALFIRIAAVAKAAPTDYTRLLVTAVLIWLSVQMMINIGAMVGLLPLKGITLPMVSYGGTSIIFVMIALGIVFQVSRYTDLSVNSNRGKASGSEAYETARYSRRKS